MSEEKSSVWQMAQQVEQNLYPFENDGNVSRLDWICPKKDESEAYLNSKALCRNWALEMLISETSGRLETHRGMVLLWTKNLESYTCLNPNRTRTKSQGTMCGRMVSQLNKKRTTKKNVRQ